MDKQIKIEKNNRNGGFCADYLIGCQMKKELGIME